jgi:FHA domain
MEGQFLRVTDGNAAGTEIPLDDGLLIGRSASGDGSLGGDPELSREHANIKWAGVQLLIEDLGSTNGTFVNGARITEATPIRPGDEIGIGASTVEVAGTVPPGSDPTLAAAPPPIQPTRIAPAAGAEGRPEPASAPGPPPAAGPPPGVAGPPPGVAGPPPGVAGPPPGVAGPPPGMGGPPGAGGMPPAMAARLRKLAILAALAGFLVGFAIAAAVFNLL